MVNTESEIKNDVAEGRPRQRWCDFKTLDGSIPIFSPPGLVGSRRPVVTVGRFKHGSGDLCCHFRQYSQHQPGGLQITRHGISLTLAELDIVIARITQLVPQLLTSDALWEAGHE